MSQFENLRMIKRIALMAETVRYSTFSIQHSAFNISPATHLSPLTL